MRQVRIVLPESRCNLRCKYCINGGNITECGTFDMEKLVSKLERLTFDTIGIWGGEPLANPWLESLLIILRTCFPDVEIHVLSNGTLLDEHFVQMLNELDIHYGISHDGKMQHLRCKDFLKEPTYIKRLQALKHFTGFNCVVSRDNCDLVSAYKYLCEAGKEIKGDWQITFEPFELSLEKTLQYMPSVEQYPLLFKSYKELVRIAEKGAPHIQNFSKRRKERAKMPKLWRCGAENRITLDCEGNAYLCQVMADTGVTAVPKPSVPMMCVACRHVAYCRGICPNVPDYLRKKMCMNYHIYYDALESLDKEDAENAPF